MTPREKRLLIAFSIFATLGVVFGLYYFVVSPWQHSRAEAKTLALDYDTKNETLYGLNKKQEKLKSLLSRSLPGDTDVARREYESLLDSIAHATGVPNGYTRTPKAPGDDNRVPVIAPKVPAYSRIGYEIVLRKVDLPTLVKFLEAYYKQPVLQQITRFTIKRTAAETTESGTKKSSEARNDLEVTIATEGVIIHNAEKRQTLYPIPNAFGALAGGMGMNLLQQKTRGVLPLAPKELADNRDYALLAAKDLFHGPLPPRPGKVIKVEEEDKKPIVITQAPPKEDISPFIRLTGITWHANGTVDAEILDMANRHEYQVSRVFKLDGTLGISVKKNFFIGTERKPLDSFDDLVIHEDGTATDRKFKVLEFTGDGLLLSEAALVLPPKDEKASEEPAPAEDAKNGKNGQKVGSKIPGKPSIKAPPKKISTPQAPGGALVGPIAFVPAEKLYLWRIGTNLKQIEQLTPPAKKVEEPVMKIEEPVKQVEPAKLLEAAPMPRIEK